MGLSPILPGAVLLARGAPRRGPAGRFCSCRAATLPHTVIPPAHCEVIALLNPLGALQVGGGSQTAFASL